MLLSLQQPNSGSSSRPSNGDKGEIVVENDWVSVEMNDYEVSLPLLFRVCIIVIYDHHGNRL